MLLTRTVAVDPADDSGNTPFAAVVTKTFSMRTDALAFVAGALSAAALAAALLMQGPADLAVLESVGAERLMPTVPWTVMVDALPTEDAVMPGQVDAVNSEPIEADLVPAAAPDRVFDLSVGLNDSGSATSKTRSGIGSGAGSSRE